MTTRDSETPLNVLLVEDDSQDTRLIREALRDFEVPHKLFAVENGCQALKFLRKEPPYEAVPVPGLILMDLNMPVMDGRRLLEIVKTDPEFGRIPVTVFSNSTDDADVIASYQLYANSFVRKPANWAKFKESVRGIIEFWYHSPELPP